MFLDNNYYNESSVELTSDILLAEILTEQLNFMYRFQQDILELTEATIVGEYKSIVNEDTLLYENIVGDFFRKIKELIKRFINWIIGLIKKFFNLFKKSSKETKTLKETSNTVAEKNKNDTKQTSVSELSKSVEAVSNVTVDKVDKGLYAESEDFIEDFIDEKEIIEEQSIALEKAMEDLLQVEKEGNEDASVFEITKELDKIDEAIETGTERVLKRLSQWEKYLKMYNSKISKAEKENDTETAKRLQQKLSLIQGRIVISNKQLVAYKKISNKCSDERLSIVSMYFDANPWFNKAHKEMENDPWFDEARERMENDPWFKKQLKGR